MELGVDDHIVRLLSPGVLVARVNRMLQRKSDRIRSENDTIGIHDLTIDPVKHEVRASGKLVSLTLSEFKLLQILSQKPGRVYSWSQLITAIRGDGYVVSGRSVDVLVVNLRKKLGRMGEKIRTVRGVGYKMQEP